MLPGPVSLVEFNRPVEGTAEPATQAIVCQVIQLLVVDNLYLIICECIFIVEACFALFY